MALPTSLTPTTFPTPAASPQPVVPQQTATLSSPASLQTGTPGKTYESTKKVALTSLSLVIVSTIATIVLSLAFPGTPFLIMALTFTALLLLPYTPTIIHHLYSYFRTVPTQNQSTTAETRGPAQQPAWNARRRAASAPSPYSQHTKHYPNNYQNRNAWHKMQAQLHEKQAKNRKTQEQQYTALETQNHAHATVANAQHHREYLETAQSNEKQKFCCLALYEFHQQCAQYHAAQAELCLQQTSQSLPLSTASLQEAPLFLAENCIRNVTQLVQCCENMTVISPNILGNRVTGFKTHLVKAQTLMTKATTKLSEATKQGTSPLTAAQLAEEAKTFAEQACTQAEALTQWISEHFYNSSTSRSTCFV